MTDKVLSVTTKGVDLGGIVDSLELAKKKLCTILMKPHVYLVNVLSGMLAQLDSKFDVRIYQNRSQSRRPRAGLSTVSGCSDGLLNRTREDVKA